MYAGFYEEGDRCPECFKGTLYYPPVQNCTCHINPPCSACTDRQLECDKCGYQPEEPEYKDMMVTHMINGVCLVQIEYKPQPLDNTKIDYRVKMHTSSSQICEGVYPEGTTRAEVEKKVRGSFGGRFEHFGNGKFKYIAYTD
jgi:hypothetical protein